MQKKVLTFDLSLLPESAMKKKEKKEKGKVKTPQKYPKTLVCN